MGLVSRQVHWRSLPPILIPRCAGPCDPPRPRRCVGQADKSLRPADQTVGGRRNTAEHLESQPPRDSHTSLHHARQHINAKHFPRGTCSGSRSRGSPPDPQSRQDRPIPISGTSCGRGSAAEVQALGASQTCSRWRGPSMACHRSCRSTRLKGRTRR